MRLTFYNITQDGLTAAFVTRKAAFIGKWLSRSLRWRLVTSNMISRGEVIGNVTTYYRTAGSVSRLAVFWEFPGS